MKFIQILQSSTDWVLAYSHQDHSLLSSLICCLCFQQAISLFPCQHLEMEHTHSNPLINMQWNHYLTAPAQTKLALEYNFPFQNICEPPHQGYTNNVVLCCHPVEFRGGKDTPYCICSCWTRWEHEFRRLILSQYVCVNKDTCYTLHFLLNYSQDKKRQTKRV